MHAARLPVLPLAAALLMSEILAVFPSRGSGQVVFWLLVDLALLMLAARGRRWALTTLAYFSAVAAVVLLLAGASQFQGDPRYFLRGLVLALVALILLRHCGTSSHAGCSHHLAYGGRHGTMRWPGRRCNSQR